MNSQALTRRASATGVSIAAQGMDPIQLGEVLARSGFFQDSRDGAQAAVKVMAGAELGFGPVASMTGIYIVKGRVTLSANLMAAAIKAHPRYTYRIRKHSERECVIDFIEDGEVIGTSAFTIEDAQKAGLAGGESYRKHPRNMLFARAMSNGAKWYCPDAFGGGPVYTPDELDVEVDGATGEVLEPQALVPEPGPEPEPEPVESVEPVERLSAATVEVLMAARAEANVTNDWLRMQLVAAGVEDVPERITVATIKRLSEAQAQQLLSALNSEIDAREADDDNG